jgi:hypothetical protein
MLLGAYVKIFVQIKNINIFPVGSLKAAAVQIW